MLPPPPARQSIPQIVWVVGALLVVALILAMSYILVVRPRTQSVAVTTPPPATATTVPATTTTTAPTQTATVPQNPQPGTPTTQPGTPHRRPRRPPLLRLQIRLLPSLRNLRRSPNRLSDEIWWCNRPCRRWEISASVPTSRGRRSLLMGAFDPSWVTPFTIPELPVGAHNVRLPWTVTTIRNRV